MSAEPAESRPAQRKQARQRSRLTFAITLVFFVCGVVAVVQLLAIHRELNQRAGENIVWALAQAQNHRRGCIVGRALLVVVKPSEVTV